MVAIVSVFFSFTLSYQLGQFHENLALPWFVLIVLSSFAGFVATPLTKLRLPSLFQMKAFKMLGLEKFALQLMTIPVTAFLTILGAILIKLIIGYL